MTQLEFHNALIVFFREAIPTCSSGDDLEMELLVRLQPNMITFTGSYFIESARHTLDLLAIEKVNCKQIREKIATYHFKTTTGGINKWNVVKWIYSLNGDIKEYLTRDFEWEKKTGWKNYFIRFLRI